MRKRRPANDAQVTIPMRLPHHWHAFGWFRDIFFAARGLLMMRKYHNRRRAPLAGGKRPATTGTLRVRFGKEL